MDAPDTEVAAMLVEVNEAFTAEANVKALLPSTYTIPALVLIEVSARVKVGKGGEALTTLVNTSASLVFIDTITTLASIGDGTEVGTRTTREAGASLVMNASAGGVATVVSAGLRVGEIFDRAVEVKGEGEGLGGPTQIEFVVATKAPGGDGIMLENPYKERSDAALWPATGKTHPNPIQKMARMLKELFLRVSHQSSYISLLSLLCISFFHTNLNFDHGA